MPSSRTRGRKKRRLRLPLWASALLAFTLGGWFLAQPPGRQQEVVRLLRNTWDREKAIDLVDVAWDLYQLYYSDDFIDSVASGDRRFAYGGLPRPVTLVTPLRELGNQGYIAGYADLLGNPLWVAYRIADVAELKSPAARPEAFFIDTRTVARVRPEDYSNSGFDRGHLAPNYGIASRYGEQAQRETFLMSNISPQQRALNAGPWKTLETRIATSYPARFGEVWVFAGPIFGMRPQRLRGAVAVPEAFYMIIVDEYDGRVRSQAFILPQEADSNEALATSRATVDEIEQRTGLDFFHELDDEAENALEARRVERVW